MNERYSPLYFTIEENLVQHFGSYIYDADKEIFIIEHYYTGFTDLNSPAESTYYIMKKVTDRWEISINDEATDNFIPLNTAETEMIKKFILQKHEYNGKIIYPHPSHPYA